MQDKMKRLILALVLLLIPVRTGASALSVAAAALTPGSFVELTTNGITDGVNNIFETTSPLWHILEFGGKGTWKASANGTGEFYYFGSSHDSGVFVNRFVKYVESTNTWSLISTSGPFANCADQVPFCVTHSYDHQTIRAADGIYYHRRTNSQEIQRFDIASQTWLTPLTNFIDAALGGHQQVGTIEIFPTMGASGSLIFGDSYTMVSAYSPQKQLMVYNSTSASPTGFGVARWDFTTSVGSKLAGPLAVGYRKMYKLDAAGVQTALADAPCDLHASDSPPGGFLMPDPVNGNFLILCRDGNMYSLDPTGTGTYTNLNVTLPFVFNTAANRHTFVSIQEYGVVMLIERPSQAVAKVWLYKPPTDFATRCAAAGVLRCFGFDSDGQLGGQHGDNFGRFASGGTCASGTTNCPVIDTAVKASGAGSIKFTVPTLSGQAGVHSSATQWFTNITSDLSNLIAAGETLYVQWRQRINAAMLGSFYKEVTGNGGTLTLSATSGSSVTATTTVAIFNSSHVGQHIFSWADPKGASGVATITGFTSSTQVTVNITTPFTSTTWLVNTWGNDFPLNNWKFIIIGQGDVAGSGCSSASTANCSSSCTVNDLVGTAYSDKGFPILYQSCGSFEGIYDEVTIPGSIMLENMRPSPYCLYPNGGNCLMFVADNWMVFMVRITAGTRGGAAAVEGTSNCIASPNNCWQNSRIDFYGSLNGQAREHLIGKDWNYHVGAAGNCPEVGGVKVDCEIGKVWLTPFMTTKSRFQDHPELNLWYDELIISTQEIAWPGAALGGAPNPVVLRLSGPLRLGGPLFIGQTQ
jgi:hypothetical protein